MDIRVIKKNPSYLDLQPIKHQAGYCC